jgi:taurine transport system substrate-binding protein
MSVDHSRRRLLKASLALAAASAAGVTRAAGLPASVRLGFAGQPRAWVLGKTDNSYDKALGVPIEWVSFPSGAQGLTLLASGQIDIAVFGSSPIAAGLVRKLPIKIIGSPEIIATSERLIVRKGITDIRQLEGKTIAYPPGSTPQYAFEAAVRAFKLDSSKIKRLSLTPGEAFAAWRRGDIDAAYLSGPAWNNLLADGGVQLLASQDLQKYGYFVWNSAVVRTEFAERHPDLVVKYLRESQNVIGRYQADPQAAAQALGKALGAPVDATLETLAGLSYPSLITQLTPAFWGSGLDTPDAQLVKALADTARFLAETGQIKAADIPSSFAPFVATDLMVKASLA